MPIVLWVMAGGASVAAFGWGADKTANAVVKGAVAGAALYYIVKKL